MDRLSEMERTVKNYCDKRQENLKQQHLQCDHKCDVCAIRALQQAGYRKESNTAKEIFNRLWYLFKTESCASTIKEVAESYGVDLK